MSECIAYLEKPLGAANTLDEQRPIAIGALGHFVKRFEEVCMPNLKAINCHMPSRRHQELKLQEHWADCRPGALYQAYDCAERWDFNTPCCARLFV